jgi:hypothetical protein
LTVSTDAALDARAESTASHGDGDFDGMEPSATILGNLLNKKTHSWDFFS